MNTVGYRRQFLKYLPPIILIVGLISIAWGISDSIFDRPKHFTPSEDVNLLVESQNAFAFDLYHQLKDQPGNLFLSPYSIAANLSMTHAGARGATARELAAVLHFSESAPVADETFRKLNSRFESLQHWGKLAVHAKNSLWYQSGTKLSPNFLRTIDEDYQGEAVTVDFKNGLNDASQSIAKWIRDQTGGHFDGSYDVKLLDDNVRLVLCDAIYFHGEWANTFKKKNTRSLPFSISANKTVTVPMMSQKKPFRMAYFSDENFRLLEMPYYGHDLSMVVLLPGEIDGLPELEKNLSQTNLQRWLGELDKSEARDTRVSFPRFSFKKAENLKPVLKNMGVRQLFSEGADLSGMDSTTNLFVSALTHQAFIDVNEKGTEATAITFMLAKTKGIDPSFIANHPFIFLIRDNATSSILFIGRLVDPTQQ